MFLNIIQSKMKYYILNMPKTSLIYNYKRLIIRTHITDFRISQMPQLIYKFCKYNVNYKFISAI